MSPQMRAPKYPSVPATPAIIRSVIMATGDMPEAQLRIINPDKGFSGSGLETIAGLKVELGLERVDLVGGNGGDDVNEGVDDGSMPGQIEGRELLDMADDGLSHVPGLEQYPFTSPCELQASDI